MKIYQVSTLQALALGYSRAVVTVGELLQHGNIGLGTFEDVNGEMIVVDGECYRATEDGTAQAADHAMGVPFAAVARAGADAGFTIGSIADIGRLKEVLTLKIEEGFGLNSMHIARIDGIFSKVCARSESAYRSHHVDLKDILSKTQRDFLFENITGTLVCVYYPDYMDGINAPGWHVHFLSQDRTKGGHVFDLAMTSGKIRVTRVNRIEIQLPSEPAFDTYSLKEASGSDIKKVEQGDSKH
ncbi:MAG: acetolactate decarboxylase [Clostridia bacterium]|nr:acetolactate decarboxylase [Clostridia bacterium]